MKKILLALAMIATMTANAQSTWRDTNPTQNNNPGVGAGYNNGYNNGYNGYGNNGYGNGYYTDERDYMNPQKRDYIRPADKKEVTMVVNMMKKMSFDDQRLEAAKVCISLRPMMAEDIQKMAKTFTFDDGRMKFLEFAFPYCVDREKYYIMSDVFTFRSNTDKFFKSIKYDRNNRYGHYDKGHGNGHDNGHNNGYGNGHDNGHNNGYGSGHK